MIADSDCFSAVSKEFEDGTRKRMLARERRHAIASFRCITAGHSNTSCWSRGNGSGWSRNELATPANAPLNSGTAPTRARIIVRNRYFRHLRFRRLAGHKRQSLARQSGIGLPILCPIFATIILSTMTKHEVIGSKPISQPS